MGKVSADAAKAAVAESPRVERLARFADGLEQLAGRWEREARDPRVAAALSERFGASAPELLATQEAVGHLLAASFGTPGALPPKLLLRLHDALAALAVLAAYTPPATELNVVPIVDVKSRAQAVRLETSARKLLKGLGRALAVGAVGASVLAALPAAAADYISPHNGGNGSNGSANVVGGDGNGGGNGGTPNETISGTYSANGSVAVQLTANGGEGGNGGEGIPIILGTYGEGGDGGTGGNGGTATLTVSGDVSTTGDNATGVQVLANAGSGGDGGDGSGIGGVGGDGAGGGTGGKASLTNHATVITHGAESNALYVKSAGGAGGDGGTGSGAIGVGGSGSHSGPGGEVYVNNDGDLNTFGARSSGILAQSIGGQSGAGGSAGGIGAFAGGSEAAGPGGKVSVFTYGDITTIGDDSYGVLAQSVGGGGGAAGGAGGIAALGGSGSGGGAGGQVDVLNGGVIDTDGVRAIGLFAQSVGGSGGVGGGGAGLVGIGGKGGSSGNGGAVTATNDGEIYTHKNQATGIFAQSIGGGGGNGAGGVGLVGVGGGGGASGNGGAVTVTNTGVVETDGAQAQAVFAQSVGGGGGNGASAGGLAAIGGGGGAGGDAGVVTVTNTGELKTHGYDSYAVFAQSVGGGGGNGGGAGGQFAIGGGGTGGGIGEAVIVTNHGRITTDHDGSGGVFAQSVGGGGGNGGGATSVGVFVNLSIGGSAGTGSKGGDVTVVNGGSITTGGDRASAIYAQSVGGGGGTGGFGVGAAAGLYGAVSIGVGGSGGGGGGGGVVHVTADGTLTTTGADSRGVFAQSVGGGGGDGGYTVAAALAVGDVGAVSGSIAVGGTGGAASDGGAVTVDHNSTAGVDIYTSGDRAVGIFAQSVGGGGGNGGWSGSIAAAVSGGASASIGVAVGGSGGNAGKGGKVTVDTAGQIHTKGVDASGIYAQSIGGGGGTGGFALAAGLSGGTAAGSASIGIGGSGAGGGDAEEVKVISVTDILTEGDRSAGIYAQAVGGGGGSGGWSGAVAGAAGQAGGAIGVSIGGNGDKGGKGGLVTVNSTGDIETRGADAAGIFGQSVGGGGGSGGFSIAAGVAVGQGALGGSVGVGGSGDGGGDADIVTIDSVGNIKTKGDRSAGVFAQSIGGGGGNGGWSGSLAIAAGQTAGAVGVSVGGSGALGGKGKAVTVTSTGAIDTKGHDAAGVMAQSVGGGGGTGGFSLAAGVGAGQTAGSAVVSVGGNGGAGNDAEKVKVTSDGVITTKGDRSYGVQAQSIGGGGGSGGFTGALSVGAGQSTAAIAVGIGGNGAGGGKGGDVEVDVIDLILTLGDDATAVLAQSIGGGGGSGGFSLTGSAGIGQTSGSGSLGIGGKGGAAGDAGDLVKVTSHADISTNGARANGIQAQSIGGGGGAGGWTGALAIAAGKTSGAVSVGVGGNGAGGGAGKEVKVDSFGQIQTHGDDAVGILAQSIGGGGGSGGFSIAAGGASGQSTGAGSLSIGGGGGVGGDGGVVTVNSHELIETENDRAYGIQAQSIGGGGGAGGFSAAVTAALSSGSPKAISASIGGSGGSGGDAKTVTVTSDVGAVTHGEAAHGLIAQSIGGGGGSGGFSIAGTLTQGTSTIGLSAAIGGSGGSAGDAGEVHVTTDGVTTTEGARAYGVFAQSVGGGGGDGGFAGALTGGLSSTDNIAIGVSLGGTGGSAGIARLVEVTNNGKVGTTGDGATAIFAQSVGGGGGAGGMAVSAALGGAKSKNISIGLGGSGGGGGKGGDVKVTSTDLVVTEGDDATAIFAQSVGGGGGAGGAAGALAVSGGESTNLAMNIGGAGATGSIGGNVTVTNSGMVVTHGEQSHGIFAESIGGGGGHGGMAGIDENQWSDYMAGGAGTVSLGSNSNNISVALGGAGGTGNDGGEVRVINSGVVATTGESQANAIYAQSIGGGGGDAGVATAASGSFGQGKNGTYAIALGGTGGAAGDGKLVDVKNSGSLSTVGGNSSGIVAQSVGGGGGSGGDARGFSLSFSKKASGAGTAKATSVNISIGGQGGAAGDGGEVWVDNSGQILTQGGDSHGVFAQSVGGGGGRGGLISTQGEEVVTFLDMANKGEAKGGQIAIGGSGAGGGDGFLVDVKNSGVIWTKGKDSHGVFAQSVGGGGGDGGSGLAGEVSIGGQGGVAGDGGEVRVKNTGTIVTEGALSRGVFAQSVGGGGGTGGATDYDGDDTYSYSKGLSDTMKVVGNITSTIELVQSFSEPAWGISIGGTGGSAGDGGLVTVTNDGAIYTSGRLSHGIMAQSVGGGGGTGGEGTITAVGQIVFSGVGGTAGDGGAVTVINNGLIQTEGYGAYGIFAQSVGGGGGVAGDTSLGIASWGDFGPFGGEDYSDYGKLSVNPLDGYGGDGGDVKVTNTGDIILLGEGSIGIFAQSVGGGGGLFGSGLGLSFAGSLGGTGDAGTVTVIQNGNIWAGAKNGIGAFFQSQAGDIPAAGSHSLSAPSSTMAAAATPTYAAADIIGTLNGDVRGGSVYGKGVFVDGGKNNTITLNGVVSAGSNLAILSTTGNDTFISNKGVVGNIDLGRGLNAFVNSTTSTLQTLDYVKLNGGLLTNDGVFTPGGNGHVQTTTVEGDFKQTTTGVFLTDLDLGKTGKAGEIDRLDLTGSLDLKGKFVLQIADPGHILPGDHTATILNGSGTVSAAGVQLVAPTSSIATFELKTTKDDLNLHYVVDFSPAGFNVNRTAVGDHINSIQLAGSTDAFAPVTAELFWEPSQVNLANYYDSFSAETYADQVAVTNFAIAGFTDSMMTCPTTPGQDEADDCVWTKAGGRQLTLDATAQDMAYRERSAGLSGGFERGAGSHWRLGLALSGESLRTGVPTRTQGDGDRYQVGVVAKAIDGPASAAMAFTAGTSTVDTRRAVLLPSGLRMAEAKQKQTFQAITVRGAYRFGTDKAYAKPIAEVNWSRISTDAFAEKGAGALNLVAPKQADQSTRASVKLEVGGEFMQGVTAIRPYARIGASQMLSGRAPLFQTAFEGAPPVAGTYGVAARLDKTTADAELGVSMVNAKGASAKLNWSGQFGDRVSNQALAVKFTLPF